MTGAKDLFREVIGRSDAFLDGERERIRFEETALGNLAADVMRERTGAQIAFVNSAACAPASGRARSRSKTSTRPCRTPTS